MKIVLKKVLIKIWRLRIFQALLTDKIALKIAYSMRFNRTLNLKNPSSFNEKLQWLKLNDHNPLYTKLVDKYEVRKYIAKIIGEEYLVPLMGVWDKFDDIDFSKLPNQFVLKCTHDSGSVIICTNKSELNMHETREQINKNIKRNFYWHSREWPYKNVKPRIICEKMMDSQIFDYKIFCFNGKPKFLYIGQGLVSDHSLKIDFYDLSWNKMPFKRTDYDNFDKVLEKPTRFDEMLSIAEKLADEISFVRVDLYEVSGRLYFSEFTFTPGGGHIPFEPSSFDELIGSWLRLPIEKSLFNNV